MLADCASACSCWRFSWYKPNSALSRAQLAFDAHQPTTVQVRGLPLLYEAPHPPCRAYSNERRQSSLRGAYLPSCSRINSRSAAQPVGSLITKASQASLNRQESAPPLKVLSKAPRVVG